MALPITVPYTFGTATSAIPLSNLDSDFATVYSAVNGIGNGTVALANVSITGGNIGGVSLTLDSINNTPIGSTTPSTGAFTSLSSTLDATIHGLTVGKGGGSETNTTVLGNGAVAATNSGGYLTAVGKNALAANTSGVANDSFGYTSLASNTTGGNNTGFGIQTLTANTTGSNNVAVGRQALYFNTTASNNTAVGYQAGYSGTTASYNTFIGSQAGYTNSTGSYNTFIGRVAAYTASGSYNLCVGDSAGYSLTTGKGNTFIGNNVDGAGNAAGYYVTTGNYNTILGNYGGNQGGLDIRTANNYIVLSDGAGNPRGYFDNNGTFHITTSAASYQMFSLNNTDTNNSNYDTVIGFTRNGNYTGGIAQPNQTTTAYNTSSDYRLKNNIQPMTGALAKVEQLKPCTYNWIVDNSPGQGFIAHELQAVVPDCVTGAKDAVDAEGKPVYQGVDTSFLVATLTAAIQEQQALITDLTNRIKTLEAK